AGMGRALQIAREGRRTALAFAPTLASTRATAVRAALFARAARTPASAASASLHFKRDAAGGSPTRQRGTRQGRSAIAIRKPMRASTRNDVTGRLKPTQLLLRE